MNDTGVPKSITHMVVRLPGPHVTNGPTVEEVLELPSFTLPGVPGGIVPSAVTVAASARSGTC